MKNGCITEDGSKAWYVEDKRHRLDGPAYEGADGSKYWCVDDKLHRLDGPAIERADGTKQWWVYGKKIDEKEIMDRHQLSYDWETWTDAEKTLFRLAV
jgi:hypothetical protein